MVALMCTTFPHVPRGVIIVKPFQGFEIQLNCISFTIHNYKVARTSFILRTASADLLNAS